MFKQMLVAVLFAAFSLTAQAQWVAGAGFVNLSDEEDGLDLSLNAFGLSLGYEFQATPEFTWLPEVRVGFGMGDDTEDFFGFRFKIELNRLVAFTLRGQYALNENVYLFAQPSYANLDVEVSTMGISVSDDDWEFGFGGGAGYRLSERVAAEFSYENFDGTDIWAAALKFAL